MRVVILILLIALAPLRGMANELMATRMASALVATATAPATPGAPQPSGHHCEEMAASAMPEQTAPATEVVASHHAEPAASTASHDGCENCSLCQMCASAALPAALAVAQPVLGPRMQVPAHNDRFASALAALVQKPPIS
jgi:hypothetical protein